MKQTVRYFLAFIVLTFSIPEKSVAQVPDDFVDRIEIAPGKSVNAYTSDTLKKQFFKNNFEHLLGIENSLYNLPIDRCHHGSVNFKIVVDSAGSTTFLKLISPSINKKQDSLIMNCIYTMTGKWVPVNRFGQNINFSCELGFLLFNTSSKTKTTRNESTKRYSDYSEHRIEWGIYQKKSYTENCENADYFYKAGLDELKAENFKRAIYNFSSVGIYNHFDTEALNKLALAYIKSNKFDKACNALKDASEFGDENAQNLYIQNCEKLK